MKYGFFAALPLAIIFTGCGERAETQSLKETSQLTTSSDKAIINWNEFTFEAGEKIHVETPGKESQVLFRVKNVTQDISKADITSSGTVRIVDGEGNLLRIIEPDSL